jgi:hypothetical protein
MVYVLIAAAAAFLGWGVWEICRWEPDTDSPLWFTSTQVAGIITMGSAMLPTIAAFGAITGSVVAFFGKQRIRGKHNRQWVFIAFVLLVLALGFWTHAMECMTDCSGAFEQGTTVADLPGKLPKLNHYWRVGASCARLGTVCFFLAADITVIIAIRFVGKSEEDNPT